MIIANLRAEVTRLQGKCGRAAAALEAEQRAKHLLHLKAAELQSKLVEARQGLRETRGALENVQSATERLLQRRDDGDAQLRKVIEINRTLESRAKDAERLVQEQRQQFKSEITRAQ